MSNRKEMTSIKKVFALLKVLERDKRYDPESYAFVMSALNLTTQKLKRQGHITGQELLEGIKEYALEQFGPMSRFVLEHWGIKTTNDFGEIVFNMIDAGMLGRSGGDSKEDFDNCFDFKDVFDKAARYTLR